MMNKLKQHLYDDPDQVIADARLIIENCRVYNDEESEICKVRMRLFMDILQELFFAYKIAFMYTMRI